jgi:F0F1-type ATP synthase assembly protein I
MNDESGRPARVSNSRDAQAQSSGESTEPSRGREGNLPSGDQVVSSRTQSAARQKAFFTSVDASLLGLGSQMMSEVVAGVLLGYGLDYLLGTKNRWIVVGSIAGIAVAMVTVFRLALKKPPPRPARPGWRPKTPATDGTATDQNLSKNDESHAQSGLSSSDESGAQARIEHSETGGRNHGASGAGGPNHAG